MDKSIKWRIATVAAVLFIAVLYLMPTLFKGQLPSWWFSFLPDKSISLGLDLRGGSYLVMEADLDVALENSLARSADDFRRTLADENIPYVNVDKGEGLVVEAEFKNDADLEAGLKALAKTSRLEEVSRKGYKLILAYSDKEVQNIKQMTTQQALETIRNRVDMFGVAEPDIRPQGDNQIVIQLPGLDDTKRAVALIGKTAVLEFKLVENTSPGALENALKNGPPVGTQILYSTEKQLDGTEVKRPYLLKKTPLMTGENLTDALVGRGEFNLPEVFITFDGRGAREFERITAEYTGRNLAIVLDGVVYSAPNIKGRIAGGRATINGMSGEQEASDLAVVLRAGALPAPVKVAEERIVGPSLGQDSINQGLTAGLWGLGILLLFMVFYYRLSGIIAAVALATNLPIILGVLAGFGATLTLPGIFGLVLTLGMAVDANVLIFERIREEVRSGKTPRAAVESGFGRAFWTIFDSNLTTLITALVLFQFGTGPIRGFAVTLSVGILSSMFTGIFFSRLIFDLALGSKNKVSKLSI